MVCERFSQVVHCESELFFRDQTIPISIENPKGVKNILLNPSVTSQHHVNEFVEVDSVITVFVHVSYHVLKLEETRSSGANPLKQFKPLAGVK